MSSTDQWFQREASFFQHPNTRSVKRVHLAHPTKRSKFGHTMSLCGSVPLISEKDHGEFPEDFIRDYLEHWRSVRCRERIRDTIELEVFLGYDGNGNRVARNDGR